MWKLTWKLKRVLPRSLKKLLLLMQPQTKLTVLLLEWLGRLLP